MNALLPRGLATLAFLCLAPRASALVITQANTTAVSFFAQGSGTGLVSGNVPFAPFDAGLGTLTAVTYHYAVSFTASSSEFNPGFPTYTYTPRIATSPIVFFVGGLSIPPPAGQTATEPEFTFTTPTGMHTITAAFAINVSHTWAGPTDLAHFFGPTPVAGITTVHINGENKYGSLGGSGTLTSSLTYTYNVADGGGNLALLTVALIGVLAIHR